MKDPLANGRAIMLAQNVPSHSSASNGFFIAAIPFSLARIRRGPRIRELCCARLRARLTSGKISKKRACPTSKASGHTSPVRGNLQSWPSNSAIPDTQNKPEWSPRNVSQGAIRTVLLLLSMTISIQPASTMWFGRYRHAAILQPTST
jgi:hypothetical protein